MVLIEAQNPSPSTYLLLRAHADAQGSLFFVLLASAMLSMSVISKFTNYTFCFYYFPQIRFLSSSKILQGTHRGHTYAALKIVFDLLRTLS